jgi:hypothetical protein
MVYRLSTGAGDFGASALTPAGELDERPVQPSRVAEQRGQQDRPDAVNQAPGFFEVELSMRAGWWASGNIIDTAGRLVGHFYIHNGDDSGFVCERG